MAGTLSRQALINLAAAALNETSVQRKISVVNAYSDSSLNLRGGIQAAAVMDALFAAGGTGALLPTGATAGTPGAFTPAGALLPKDLANMAEIVASPATAWTTGQRVVLADTSVAHWSSTAWVVGNA